MALWQFKMTLVPTELVGDRSSLTEQEYNEEWMGLRQPPEDFKVRFAAILPSRKSWADNLAQWGRQDGDLIEVWQSSDRVESISARIDCRDLNAQFIRQIFDLAREWGFRLVYNRYRTVLPDDWEGFVRAVCDSPNLKFMQAPEVWLPKLAKEVSQSNKKS